MAEQQPLQEFQAGRTRDTLSPVHTALSVIGILTALLAAGGCSTTPPSDISDGCEIFEDKNAWYKSTKRARDKWGVPIHIQLAIIYQESKFIHDAKAPRDHILWVIPWGRISSAYGYAQAQDATWDWYIQKTGNRGADRDDFSDAVDFISWYVSMSHRLLGISKWDAYEQYLAYHEGHGGYKRATYKAKPWLLKVARKVDARAKAYHAQLQRCEKELDSGWSIWPF